MSESEQFRAIATAMLDRRIRNMRRLDEKTWIDTSLITHVEYQLFLDEMYAQGKYHQPDHWKGKRFASGEAQAPVVGVRPSDAEAFCEWLSNSNRGRFRLPGQIETTNMENGWPGFWQINDKTGMEYMGQSPAQALSISLDINRYNKRITNTRLLRRILASYDEVNLNTDLNLDYDLKDAHTIYQDLASDSASIFYSGLERALNRNYDIIVDLPLSRDLELPQDLSLALARTLSIAVDRSFEFKQKLGYYQAYKSTSDLTLRRKFTIAIDQAFSVVIHRLFPKTIGSYLDRSLSVVSNRDLELSTAIDRVRNNVNRFKINLTTDLSNDHIVTIAKYSSVVYRIILDFLILSLRREGILPAFEGILIVREETD